MRENAKGVGRRAQILTGIAPHVEGYAKSGFGIRNALQPRGAIRPPRFARPLL